MDVFFPIARMPISIFAILGMGGLVGLLSGLFGVGGGFLLTPLLMWMGIPPAVAVASDTNQIVAASVSGTIAHSRNKNVDFKLGFIILVGSLVGGSFGTALVKVLRSLGNFDFVLKSTYVVMLLFVGGFMFIESVNTLRKKGQNDSEVPKESKAMSFMNKLPIKIHFEVSGIDCSVISLFLLGLLIGILAALMGVGGGFIMLPVMIYLLGIPTIKAVGTSVFVIIFTAINVTLAQSTLNHTVDVILAIVLLIGSSIGAQFGAKIGKRLPAEQLRVIFSIIVLAVMLKMFFDLVLPPSSLISLGGGH
ncbi:sulfite exporter TauE/SafE family protein [Desulfosporosinus meridiei]|uniref:Probable membrane transporter protein n=1 Tax=Desulfosporosinus meridiei (strain ATCC BAA-275 / DSM 13257 / KCTC 12902 / NCIMB 13706 / S10) TaxID=768704 RepID=J7IUV4_DESMD|nr:sulfite exporter TauE/SafE family protein [Desulfosporosinus meridiei]AFQ45632.1 putative permease [Desulfosporosinus meridiei DSM 13257]